MYRILINDTGNTVLYDTQNPDNYMMTEPHLTREMGQPGNLQFSLLPSHPAYENVHNMETYLSAEEDGEEIFYGRVIDVGVSPVTGVKQIQCAGAISFLDDVDMAPLGNDGITMSGTQFFTRCLNAYNEAISYDPKRLLTIGTISHSKAYITKLYKMNSWTKIKSALETNLINEYGGFLRVRKANNTRYLDWVETYGETNTSPIALMKNVISQDNKLSANNFFTVIRPNGKGNIALTEGTMVVSQELVNKYGRIIESVSFKDADTESALRDAATAYINRIGKGLGKTGSIKMVDLHFLDGTIPRIRLGAVYTNIAGLENEEMTIFSMEQNFANPANDSLELKNKKELMDSMKGGGGTGAASKNGNKKFENIFEHITETQDSLSIHAKLIELHGEQIIETATDFERFSRETENTLGEIQGSGVLQNSDTITSIVGNFTSAYKVVPQAIISKEGKNPHNSGYYLPTARMPVTQKQIDDKYWYGKEIFGSVEAAVRGEPINPKTLKVGDEVIQMVRTTHTEPQTGVTYYYKNLALGNGAEFSVAEDGDYMTVGTVLNETTNTLNDVRTSVTTMEGSALWTQRNAITGVVGEFDVIDEGGVRRLVVKSGGGMKILRNQVEYGLYLSDDGNDATLSGGVIVTKLNNLPATATKISGTLIKIGSDSTAEVEIGALKTRVGTLEADAITTHNLESEIGKIDVLGVKVLVANSVRSTGGFRYGGVVGGVDLQTGVYDIQVVPNGNNSYVLQKKTYDSAGTWVDAGTFNRATSLVSGAWSGTTYTAVPDPNGTQSVSTTVILAVEGSPNPNATVYAKIYKDQQTQGNEISTTQMTLTEDVSNKQVKLTANTLTKGVISTQATWNAGFSAGAPTSLTLGTLITGHMYNVSVARGGYAAVMLQLNLNSVYTEAYNAGYNAGLNACGKSTGYSGFYQTATSTYLYSSPYAEPQTGQYYNIASNWKTYPDYK